MAAKKIKSKKPVKKAVVQKSKKTPAKIKQSPTVKNKKVSTGKTSNKPQKANNSKIAKKPVVKKVKESTPKVTTRTKVASPPKKSKTATQNIKSAGSKNKKVKVELVKSKTKNSEIKSAKLNINKASVKENKKKEEVKEIVNIVQVPQRKIAKAAAAKGKNKPKKDPTGLPVLKRSSSADHDDEILKNRPSHSPVSKYQRFELEYPFHTTTGLLYEFFSEPSGLQEWFCNDVNVKGDIYIFYWDGSYQQAVLQKKRPEYYARFRWLDEPEDTYFEFRLETDELTRDVSLIVTDFAEDDDSRETSTRLWNAQIEKLHQILGSY